MIVEVYKSSEFDSVTAITLGDTTNLNLLEDDAVLFKTIEGKDWTDCMIQYHQLMGWSPYKPF